MVDYVLDSILLAYTRNTHIHCRHTYKLTFVRRKEHRESTHKSHTTYTESIAHRHNAQRKTQNIHRFAVQGMILTEQDCH